MLLSELGYAARVLRKSPVFALTTALTLALGVGASTAIFSVTNAVLLRPLPYRDPAHLVVALGEMRKRNVKDWPFSNADFFDLQNGTADVFDGLAAVNTGRGPIPTEDGTLEEVRFAAVTTNFFRTLGAKIAVGRDFTNADGQPQPPQPTVGSAANQSTPPLPAIAILSHEYFQRRYSGDGSILGHTIKLLGGGGPQIVGVLAPGFELLLPPSANTEAKPDIWVASRLSYDNAERNSVSHHLIARLKPGVTLDRAQQAADSVAAALRRDFPVHNTSGFYIRLEPISNHLVAAVKPALLALMGAVIFLLLIACANIANLMLVRMSSRGRELAVRASLGASRWRLTRQTLAESLLLAAMGSGLGLAMAWLGIRELLIIAPADLPRLQSVGIDSPVLVFTVMAGLVASALFGILPAVRAARPDLMRILRGTGRAAGLGTAGMRNSVVVSEIALCFVLLVGSGLMFRTFLALQHVDLGFDANNLETFQVLGPNGDEPEQRAAFMREIYGHLQSLPGVQSVAASTPFPLTGGFNPIRWGTAAALTDATKFQAVDPQIVLPGYFESMRTPLIAGRTFTEADNSPDRKVVVVDRALASNAFPLESAVGKRILIRLQTPEPEWVEIIGVVAHQRTVSLSEPGREQIYFTDGFVGHGAVTRWAVRSLGNPSAYAEPIRKELGKLNTKLLITDMQPMEAWVQQARSGTRFSLLLIGGFAVIAALLAAVGLYGVLSSVVRQRTAEIGVRMALGASPVQVFWTIVGSGLRLGAIGIAIGIVAALALTRLMITMLVGVQPSDPITIALMSLLFLVIAAVASWAPARRAAALDPAVALRED